MPKWIKYITILALSLGFVSAQASAQSIVLHEGDLHQLLEENAVAEDSLWIINGKKVLTRGSRQSRVSLGKLSGVLWNIAALRLIEMKVLDADEPAVLLLDDFELDSPFRKHLTLRHLMAGTAGFAIPAFHATTLDFKDSYSTFPQSNDWQNYITPISEPGIVARDDIVGQALLAKIILSRWNKDLDQTLQDLVFAPLGLEADIQLPDDPLDYSYDGFFAPVMDLSVSTEAFEAFLSALTDNRQADGELYLSLIMHNALMKGAAWKVHPLGPGRSYGFSTSEVNGRRSASILPNKLRTRHPRFAPAGLVAFPDAGIVIAMSDADLEATAIKEQLLKVAGLIANENISRTNYYREKKDAEALEEARVRSGYYMLDDMATAWLAEKLNRAKFHSPYIHIKRAEVTVINGNDPQVFKRIDARVYQSAQGENLYISEGSGGYLTIGESLYRYTGAMGNPYLLISPVWLCLTILFSAGLYWFSDRGKDWRRFARWSVAGAFCFVAGYHAEFYLYPAQWGMGHNGVYVIMWRALFNVGLMLILTAPMYAWRFGKQNAFHTNIRLMLLGSHVIVIAAAALVLALLSVAWGLAGELSPY